LRRNDVRSDSSHKLLWIFNEVCRQGETSHTLPCFHPAGENKSNVSLYKL
jgi:hypothetical protein